MDAFTQRMVQRAQMKPEKFNGHFAHQTIVPPEEVTQEKQKGPINNTSSNDKGSREGISDRGDRSNIRKIKLQKLALFYAGKKDLSFERDDKNDARLESQEKRTNCKLRRLAELTTRINEWEYEINRPKHKKLFNSDPRQNTKGFGNDNQKQPISKPTLGKLSSGECTLSDRQSKQKHDYQIENVCSNSRKEAIPKNALKSSILLGQKESAVSQGNDGNEPHIFSKVSSFKTGNRKVIKEQEKDPAELSLEARRALFERNSTSTYCRSTPLFHRPISHESDEKRIIPENKNCNTPKRVDLEPRKDIGTCTSPPTKGSHPVDTRYEQLVPCKLHKKEFTERTLFQNDKCVVVRPEESLQHPPKGNEVATVTWIMDEWGRLYPDLRTLDVSEITSPMFSEGDDFNESVMSDVCLNVSLLDLLEMNKNNPDTPPRHFSFYKSKESSVVNKIDRSLFDHPLLTEDETQEICSSPSIVKIMKSSSFEYRRCSDNHRLLHTVSFYRKQQQTHSSPEKSQCQQENSEDESVLVENKIQFLLTEINKQQTIMSQASQALNLCLSTAEFAGSGQQVEAERLLLLASHKRQACLNETQRLKIENRLRPWGDTFLSERDDVILSNITIRLNRDAFRTMAATENLHYFVCLVKSDEKVLATPVVAATRENLTDRHLQFPGSIKLEKLFSDFRVTVEVYSLRLSKELLSHNVKCISSKKEKKPKVKKPESRLVKSPVSGPAGLNAVRTPAFQLHGYVVFSLRELNRTRWILNKVPQEMFLEGSLSMSINSQLRLDEEFRGFLTIFDDISGYGAWHRRWCLLSSHVISIWKYPDDEQVKLPIGTIDLRSVITERVVLVPRDICARFNTFQLETTRARLPEDKNSLVLRVEDGVSTTRHLLSADNKQEMLTWCKKLNAILGLLTSWKCNSQG